MGKLTGSTNNTRQGVIGGGLGGLIQRQNKRIDDLLVERQSILATLRQLYEAIPDNEGGELGTACRDARAMLAKYDITVW